MPLMPARGRTPAGRSGFLYALTDRGATNVRPNLLFFHGHDQRRADGTSRLGELASSQQDRTQTIGRWLAWPYARRGEGVVRFPGACWMRGTVARRRCWRSIELTAT